MGRTTRLCVRENWASGLALIAIEAQGVDGVWRNPEIYSPDRRGPRALTRLAVTKGTRRFPRRRIYDGSAAMKSRPTDGERVLPPRQECFLLPLRAKQQPSDRLGKSPGAGHIVRTEGFARL